MAASSIKEHCVKCGKERATSKCAGCSQDFCYNHLTDHRQELSVELDKIEISRDLFRQTLNEQTNNQNQNSLIQQIDKWEDDSIKIIQRRADECRQLFQKYITEHLNQIEINLNKLTDKLRQLRQENDFNEIDIDEFKQKLIELTKELDKPLNISIEEDSTPFINKISIVRSSAQLLTSAHINVNTIWKQYGITIAGGNGKGNQLDQLSYPEGIYIDDDGQCIYVADCGNHRIVKRRCDEQDGEVVAGGNGEGNRIDQLNKPVDVIVDKKNGSFVISDFGNKQVIRWPRRNDNNGDLYVSNFEENEVRRWKDGETKGTIVAGGNGKGNNLNQLNYPTYVFVDQDYSVYVSDTDNHRVMKWLKDAKEGIVVAGGQGEGNSLSQLSKPAGSIVDHLGNICAADSNNHRIMCWSKGSKRGSIVVGGSGQGDEPNQLNCPTSLSFDRQGNLYVADRNNNRVQNFEIDSK